MPLPVHHSDSPPLSLTDDVYVSISDAPLHGPLDLLRHVELAQAQQTGEAVLVGEGQYAVGVLLLNGGVVRVEVLQEGKEGCRGDVTDDNLGEATEIWQSDDYSGRDPCKCTHDTHTHICEHAHTHTHTPLLKPLPETGCSTWLT